MLRCLLAGVVLAVVPAMGGPGCTSGSGTGGDVPFGASCTDDTQCLMGEACDPKTGTCVSNQSAMDVSAGGACTADGDCELGLYCSDQGVCVADPYAPDQQATGAPCVTDGDCASGLCDVHTDLCE